MIQEKISSLVSTFEMNLQTYKESKEKNESEIRKNYIDPLFALMGWNVRNEGLREYEKEVIAEYSVNEETGKKKADYCFRVNGSPVFFVEAKDPYINIEANRKVAFQIRSYCWNAKVPVGILTDFEEFSIYDGRYEPKADDSANVARIKYFKYSEYKDRWEEIAGLFSKNAVVSGSLNEWINTVKIKKGVLPVDEVFLKDMETWREIMAVNMALRNPDFSRKEINFAVQRTIDRIVFLRICEDRGTEPYGEMEKLLNTKNIYSGLVKLFRAADKRYNSGIFCFEKEKGRTEGVDTVTPNLKIDDRILKTVIERLYYPSPYNFAVMSADILGQIYERFLGKIIQITTDRKVSVEEKPEVRKAGGVYYTPTYIVDYIVKNTIEKLIAGKTPVQVEKMKFLDPACGSGSFLIQAYQHLLNWHLDWYAKNSREKHLEGKKPVLVRDRNGSIRLSIETRKKILLNNIFGVDIDFQAVEVSKLSLLLKVLEGEDDFTMQQLGLFKERALPDLGKNIKCGNSLIGPDYYENVQMNLLDEEEIFRVNAFDWNAEFAEIMKKGGFDAVIGNPPYFSLDIVSNDYKNYLQSKFNEFATKQSNIYFFFIANSFSILKEKGLLSFINERYYFNSKNAFKFRKYIQYIFRIKQIVDFCNIQIFEKVNTLTVINIFEKSGIRDNVNVIQFNQNLRKIENNQMSDKEHTVFLMKQEELDPASWIFIKDDLYKIKNKLQEKTKPLIEYISIGQGITTGRNNIFIVSEDLVKKEGLETELLKKYIKTRDIQRYKINFRNLYVILTLKDINIENYPNIKKYLLKYKKELMERYECKKGLSAWYAVSVPRNLNLFENNNGKILTPLYSKGNKFAYDDCLKNAIYYSLTDTYLLTTNETTKISLKYIIGILNSTLFNYYNENFGKLKRDGYYEYSRNTLSGIPIKTINFKETEEKNNHDQMVNLVDNMLSLHKQLQETTLPQAKTVIERQIEAIDSQIDQLVYNLYGLTKEEIKIVESES